MPFLLLDWFGEAGECAELIKKHLGHGHPLDMDKVKKELGDCFWYLARLASTFNILCSDICKTNIEKLQKRYPSGFSNEASLNRKE